ncbi:MAG: 3-phosphoglycerate dehydrogenase [Betaproteobacteria bacterium]|nr:3-phosphoglycerate dehydrogenase [Betaproteobacteria bacterium]
MSEAATVKHTFWFHESKTPSVADCLEKEHRDIEVHRLRYDALSEQNWEVMAICHAYCISSSRHEVPDEYRCRSDLLARCPQLLVVSTTGAGYDTIDLEACTGAGVLAVNQAGANAQATAEHTVGMLLALTKNMPWTDRSLHRERGVDREIFKGWNAAKATIGLIGLGEVGRRVARICASGLDMRVLAYDPYLDAQACRARSATKVSLDTLLAEARFVSVHCPLTAETQNLISSREFSHMQMGAILINTARGGIVDEHALANALISKRLAGAGVDVWAIEPPPLGHPLLGFDNFIATCHTAGVTTESRLAMAQWNADQVAVTLRGGRPPRLLNPAAWARFSQRFEAIFGFAPASD